MKVKKYYNIISITRLSLIYPSPTFRPLLLLKQLPTCSGSNTLYAESINIRIIIHTEFGARLGAAKGTNFICKTNLIKHNTSSRIMTSILFSRSRSMTSILFSRSRIMTSILVSLSSEIKPSRKTPVMPISTITTKTKVKLLGRQD